MTRNRNKRGQAALEFLMTYGWAILVVLIAIGALAYFGVLNPSKFLPASCVLLPGLSCSDFKVNASTITVIVRNGMGDGLSPFWMNISDSNSVCAGQGTPNATATLPDGAVRTFNIGNTGCSLGTANSRFKADVTVTYNTSSGVLHTRTGSIVTQIE